MKLPVCVNCGAEFRVIENGVTVLGLDHKGGDDVVYQADLFECPYCKDRILDGWGKKPIASVGGENFDYWAHQATMSYKL
jgi:DNA-directed RNA polymerase subunit RPC12/RpoP